MVEWRYPHYTPPRPPVLAPCLSVPVRVPRIVRTVFFQGRDEFVMLAEEPRVGLSHGPERYLAQGVRAPTKLPGLFLAGQDLTIAGMEGAVMGG